MPDPAMEAMEVAEEVGFEPTVSFPTHDFQSCRFGRSRTPPARRQTSMFMRQKMPWELVGPCAACVREPSQGRKAAAISGAVRVPQ